MHPQLYDVGMHGIELLDDWSCKNHPRMQHALRKWPTVFTNVSVIANQCTPLHRCHAPNMFGTVDMEKVSR